MYTEMEIYKIGGVPNTLELIYRILFLRKSGCEVRFSKFDEKNKGTFYLDVLKDSTTIIKIKATVRNNEQVVTTNLIDEHFIYTDIPTRLNEGVSFNDASAVINTYSRVCALYTLFLLIGREAYEQYSEIDRHLYQLTDYMLQENIMNFSRLCFTGNDRVSEDVLINTINGFVTNVKCAREKFNSDPSKCCPGKGRMKSLIYHVSFMNVLSIFVSIVNEHGSNTNISGISESTIISSIVDRNNISKSIKYVALESIVLFGYLSKNVSIQAGFEGFRGENSWFPFFEKMYILGLEAEKYISSVMDETYGIEVDGDVINLKMTDMVIIHIKDKVSFNPDKTKLCFRCSKHFINQLTSWVGTSSDVRNFSVLDSFGDFYAGIINKSGSDSKEYIIDGIVKKIHDVVLSTPVVTNKIDREHEKSVERLISLNIILRKLLPSNQALSDTIYTGIAYSDSALNLYYNMWLFNRQTNCVTSKKHLYRLSMMMNYFILANDELKGNGLSVKDEIISTAIENIRTIIDYSSKCPDSYKYEKFKLHSESFKVPYDNIVNYSIDGLYGVFYNEQYRDLEIFEFIEKCVKDSGNESGKTIEKLKSGVNFNKMDDDENFNCIALNNLSKLNYCIIDKITDIYRSTKFTKEEKAFIIFCCLGKLISDNLRNKGDSTYEYSFLSNTYDTLEQKTPTLSIKDVIG